MHDGMRPFVRPPALFPGPHLPHCSRTSCADAACCPWDTRVAGVCIDVWDALRRRLHARQGHRKVRGSGSASLSVWLLCPCCPRASCCQSHAALKQTGAVLLTTCSCKSCSCWSRVHARAHWGWLGVGGVKRRSYS